MVTRSPLLTFRVRNIFGNLQTSSCSWRWAMGLDSDGSSPSQISAVWSPRLSRWRSMQFHATLRTPSSNHLMEILPGAKDEFSTLENGFIQPIRLACSAQNALGSLTERAYISRYLA